MGAGTYAMTVTEENGTEIPYRATITNTPSVKLGIDSDKYDVPIAIGITLLGVGVVAWRVIAAKRAIKKKKNEEE